MNLANLEAFLISQRKRNKRESLRKKNKSCGTKVFLECHTAKVLLNTIYFYNAKLFGIRAKEYRDIRCSI